MKLDPPEIVHYAETRYGFEYGAALIERRASHKGTVVVGIGPRPFSYEIEVYVSPKGKRIRVFRGGKELK